MISLNGKTLSLALETYAQLSQAPGTSTAISSAKAVSKGSMEPVTAKGDTTTLNSNNTLREDWSEVPPVMDFYGRSEELSELRQWIVDNGCRIVTILGVGGVGKTTLAAKLAMYIKDSFEYAIWYSLQNAPPLEHILTHCIQFISNHQNAHVPQGVDNQIALLTRYLYERRCLLVLDNIESILQAGQHAGQFREKYENYGRFIQHVGEARHKSCLLMTSREKPEEVARMEGKTSPVRSKQLHGVGYDEGREILKDKGISGTDEHWATLVHCYSGNPLALKLVAEPIQEVFGGNIARFLEESETAFGDINSLLDQQFGRLSLQEREVLYWLAIEREGTSLEQVRQNLVHPLSNGTVLEALHSLRRRSMIEMNSPALFTLQPVITEYLTADLVNLFISSFDTNAVEVWSNYALIKAQSKDYVRDSQIRLILVPVMRRLLRTLGKEGIERQLHLMLSTQRRLSPHQHNYTAGNALNLLLHLQSDLRNVNFSHLVIRQAYLQDASLPDVKFAHAHFVESTFANTSGNVLSVAFSPCGGWLATGTTTGEIWIYEASSGTPLLTCHGHTDGVWSVTFSPDGQILASSSDDQTIRLWDTGTGQCLKILEGHTNRVKSVAFSLDGQILASGSEDLTVRLWDVGSGQCFNVLRDHTDRIWSVAFSPHGNVLATGGTDQTIRLWDINTGQCFNILTGHTSWVLSVSFSPAGNLLASSGDDQTIRLWDVKNGQPLKVLQGHTNRVRSVTFSPNGTILASGSEDHIIRLWSVESGRCLKILQGHKHGVRSVIFNAHGDTLASGGDDQAMRLWNVSTGHCLKTIQGYTNRIWSVIFGIGECTLMSCSEDRSIRKWDINTNSCIKILQDRTHGVRSMASGSGGRFIVSGGEDRTVRLWDANTGLCLKTLRGHSHWIRSVAFSPDGNILASGGEDLTIRLWNANTGLCLKILRGHTSWIRSIVFSPDGKLFASAGDDGTIFIWESASGSRLSILNGHASQIRSIAFGPDGQILASGGEDQAIFLWNINTGHCFNILQGHMDRVMSVAFSPDGHVLASSSDDRTIRLWDIRDGRCLKVLQGHSKRIRWVSYSFDGLALVSGSDDGSIKCWDTQTGQCLTTLLIERPYERMDITGVQGLTEAQKATLRLLGAITQFDV